MPSYVDELFDHDRKERKLIEYLLYEQRYMELMEQGKTVEAIKVLQNDLSPRSAPPRLYKLAQLILWQP